jgi:hypothetical protein
MTKTYRKAFLLEGLFRKELEPLKILSSQSGGVSSPALIGRNNSKKPQLPGSPSLVRREKEG